MINEFNFSNHSVYALMEMGSERERTRDFSVVEATGKSLCS